MAILTLLAAPFAAEVQQAEKVRRIGYLNPSSLSEPGTPPLVKAFEEGLREHGWVVGQTAISLWRWPLGCNWSSTSRPRRRSG